MNNKKAMAQIKRKIHRLMDMAATHCGHEENIWKMYAHRDKLVRAIEALVEEAYVDGQIDESRKYPGIPVPGP